MRISRDFTVIAIAKKGKAKTPTVTLETTDGEKLTLKLDESSDLDNFEIDQEFTMKMGESEQRPLFNLTEETDVSPTIEKEISKGGL